MAIPDFQTMMRPLLEILTDGQEHPNAELYAKVGDHFGVSEEERSVPIASGGAKVLNNRVAWALSHFKVAGLVESPRRGVYKIAERGLIVLAEHQQRIDLRVLGQFPEHVAFRTPRTKETLVKTGQANADPVSVAVTPEEAMSQAHQELRASLAQELLERIKQSPPAFFERLVVDVLLAMGYGGSQLDAGKTLVRCATSVGANYRAACRARSAADFVAKMKIVEEETDEAIYWLELLGEGGFVDPHETGLLAREANEILAMTVASIKTKRG